MLTISVLSNPQTKTENGDGFSLFQLSTVAFRQANKSLGHQKIQNPGKTILGEVGFLLHMLNSSSHFPSNSHFPVARAITTKLDNIHLTAPGLSEEIRGHSGMPQGRGVKKSQGQGG